MKRNAHAWLAWVGVWGLIAGSSLAGAQTPSPKGRGPSPASAVQKRAEPGGSENTIKFRITRRPRQEEAGAPAPRAPGSTFALDPGDAQWTLSINDSGEILIFHRGVQVVKGSHAFWGQGDSLAGAHFSVAARTGDQVQMSGTVDGLGLKVQGSARPASPHELRLDMDIAAAKVFSSITGGGVSWTFKLDSPSFGGKVAEPKLLLDKTGWRWPIAEGEELMVRFDAPLARLFFDHDKKNEVRTHFVGDRIRPGRGRISLTVTLPQGGRITATDEERYPKPDGKWFRDALRWDASPLDLSFLNADDRPAGRHGLVKADGDKLVFEDGTRARFWGANLSGPVLFGTPRENIPRQARRIAQLGYNIMRIVQHESNWVRPNIFGSDARDTRHLDRRSLDAIDYWIKCLKDEGVYVWLDLHYLRDIKPGDGVSQGWDEIARAKGIIWGFNYINPELIKLMKEFQHQYLSHVNRYTGLAYKDDPAVVGVLITNENDLTFHFGLSFLADHNNPVHKALFDREMAAYARTTGLPGDRLWRTWEPGPSKYLLNELEHRFNRTMIDALRTDGLKAPIATTNLWGVNTLFSLPSLTDGDVVDVHAYGSAEALSANPRYVANYLTWAASAHVHGKPLVITEWNVPYPEIDRFTAPLYVASVASLQGWDAPMLYNYSQTELQRPGPEEGRHRINKWSTFYDPAITGVMPAAAIAFRRGHISPARTSFCLKLSPAQLFETMLSPEHNTATIRTLIEQSRLTIGMPAVKELPWLKPSETSGDVTVVTDPDHDHIPAGAAVVRSDTGELARNWTEGVQTIDTPRTQAVSGWIGGKALALRDASFEFKTRKAVVALSSIDDQPLASSRFILITALGQARPSPATDMGKLLPDRAAEHLPFLSEPVTGTITLRTRTDGLELLSLGPDGKVVSRTTPPTEKDALAIRLPAGRGTHWYVLKARPLARSPQNPPARP
jgi:hypothetical protein